MQGFITFLANNYIWFLVVAIVLIFALIGYLIDSKGESDSSSKPKTIKLEDVSNVEENKTSEIKENSTVSVSQENVVEENVETLGETIEMPKVNTTVSESNDESESL